MRKSDQQKRLDALFNPKGTKPKSDIIKCTLYGQGKDVNMELRVDPESSRIVQNIARNRLSHEKTREAFVRAYYLYELLVQDYGFSEWILNEEICKSTRVSRDTMIEIRELLSYYEILFIDSKEYKESLKKHLKAKSEFDGSKAKFLKIKPYTYVVGRFINSNVIQVNKSKFVGRDVIRYKLSKKVYDLVKLYKDMERCSRADDIYAILLRFFERNCQIINNINKYLEQTNKDYPSTTYVAPYQMLELDNEVPNLLMRTRRWETLLVWALYRNVPAKVTENSRLWHPFHSLAREYRKHVTYNGSRLMEAADVHNCFYVLMLKAFEQDESIDKDELQRYSVLVRGGRFYELFVDEFVKDLPPNSYSYKKMRRQVKEWLQSYRNIINEGQLRYEHPRLDDIFKAKFPTIRNALLHYQTTINKDGKRVKKLQTDMCHVETNLISKVCFDLKVYGVTPFSLHDGIYLSEDEMEKMRVILGVKEIEDVQRWIEELFWKYFDEQTPEIVKQLINE